MMMLSRFPSPMGYVIVAMVVACLLPYVCALMSKMMGGFNPKTDNANPRHFLQNTSGVSARLNYAQLNGFESLPIFLASVLLAMYCFVPQSIVNGLAWFYVLMRVLFIVAYALNWAFFRSVAWALSLFCCLFLFYFSFILV